MKKEKAFSNIRTMSEEQIKNLEVQFNARIERDEKKIGRAHV